MKLASLFMVLLASVPAFAQLAEQTFSTQGDWHYSSLNGPEAQKSSLWADDLSAGATWDPHLKSYGPVRISFYVIGHAGNVSSATVVVTHDGRRDAKVISMTRPDSGWVDVGTFHFDGQSPESIQVSHGPAPGIVRVAGLRLEVLDPKDPTVVWQNLILDDLAPGTPGKDAPTVAFSDVDDAPVKHAASVLASAHVLLGTSPTRFSPQALLSPADVKGALAAMGKSANLNLASAMLDRLQGQPSETGTQLLAVLTEAAKNSGRNMDWLHAEGADAIATAQQMGLLKSAGADRFNAQAAVTRASGALLLLSFQQAVVDSGPPVAEQWRLSFDDEFNGSAVDWSVWNSAQGEVRGLSSRWPGNAVVSDGMLHLVTRKEDRNGAAWTAASLWTKKFQQRYGYWEARMRYAGAPGLNNAFWMIYNGTHGDGFEIDVNEGHYPGEVNATLHQQDQPDQSTRFLPGGNLAEEFHTYGCLWDQQTIRFYMDGKQIAQRVNLKANAPVPAMLSTAVIAWAGAQTAALDQKSMDVDWVRVYVPIK